MIKRVLVALDPDSDTPAATQCAVDLAQRHHGKLTGLAVVDTKHISSEVGTGGIGTIYYADQLREHLGKESRKKAQELIDQFKDTVEETGVPHSEGVEEGVPFERIMEDMKYHDILVIGRDSHFFYYRPEEKTNTLARVVKKGVAPVIVTHKEHRPINNVLLAYDGSDASARAMQAFVQLNPFGQEVSIKIIHVRDGETNKNVGMSKLILRLAAQYIQAHGYEQLETESLSSGSETNKIMNYAEDMKADLIIAGAHSVNAIKRLTFGSTTSDLLDNSPAAMLLHH